MENNINKKKSIITKNPSNTNKQEEGETNELLLGKEKTENQRYLLNQNIEKKKKKQKQKIKI